MDKNIRDIVVSFQLTHAILNIILGNYAYAAAFLMFAMVCAQNE